MLRTAVATALAIVSIASVAGAATHPATVQVRIHDLAFDPQELHVRAGSTIVWTNEDDVAHTVTSGESTDDGTWVSSPLLVYGAHFSVRLDRPGTYRYFCKPHEYNPAMHGRIIVEP